MAGFLMTSQSSKVEGQTRRGEEDKESKVLTREFMTDGLADSKEG